MYISKKRSEVQNISLRFTFVGKGNKVIDQLPRKGEYVEEGDTIQLRVGKKNLRLPAQRGELLGQKGYVGKTIVLGIRPENVYDSKLYQLDDYDNTIEAEIKVYELLGAEIFLYFDVEGKQMIARVNPNTALAKGDVAKFALDMNKAHLFDKETEQVIR